jgi:F0F1-type ATP synthase delta subunit
MNDKIKKLLENAEQSDAIAKNKWRIENREQLRKERKEKLKELMEKDKQQTAVSWFLDQLLKDGYIKRLPVLQLQQAKEMEKEQRSIEVPSDEEIGKEASVRHYGTNFKHVFASGAKWMRDKIQGGDQ